MNAQDLIDAIGQADEAYVRQAGEARRRGAPPSVREAAPVLRVYEDEPRPVREGRRPALWGAAAAVLALLLAAGSVWLLLRPVGSGADDPIQAGPGDTETLPVVIMPSADESGPEKDPVPEYNVLEPDFEAALTAAEGEEAAAACRWAQTRQPGAKNEMTGLFAGKNLILITAQCFAPQLIDAERTPTLFRLATKGVEFTDYYQPAWGGATASGEFAILTGLAPAHGVESIRESADRDMRQTVGNLLRERGYFSRAYCDDNSYDYLGRDRTHPNLGYETLIGVGNGLEAGLTRQWPYSDRETVDFTLPQYLDRQPFSVYYMLCSGQGPYTVRGNSMAKLHLDEIMRARLSCSDTVKAYLAANMELELALQDLVEALEEAGIADDTVIVLSSSQYPFALEKDEDYGNAEDYLAELYGKPVENCLERDRSSLIIWSACIEGKGYRVTTPSSSLDIVPTLCNLFGLDYDSRLLAGRDVFSDQEPLVFWPDGSWKTERYSFLAESREYFLPDGSPSGGTGIPYEYALERHREAEARLQYSGAVLDADLFALLFHQEPAALPAEPKNEFPALPERIDDQAYPHEDVTLTFGWTEPYSDTEQDPEADFGQMSFDEAYEYDLAHGTFFQIRNAEGEILDLDLFFGADGSDKTSMEIIDHREIYGQNWDLYQVPYSADFLFEASRDDRPAYYAAAWPDFRIQIEGEHLGDVRLSVGGASFSGKARRYETEKPMKYRVKAQMEQRTLTVSCEEAVGFLLTRDGTSLKLLSSHECEVAVTEQDRKTGVTKTLLTATVPAGTDWYVEDLTAPAERLGGESEAAAEAERVTAEPTDSASAFQAQLQYQDGDTTPTWDPVRTADYPADADCSAALLLEKWMAVEGLTCADLDARGCRQLILTVAQASEEAESPTFCYEWEADGSIVPVEGLSGLRGWVGRAGIKHDRRRNSDTSPAGLWAISEAFGNEAPPEGLKLPWRQVTPNSDWVCDADSPYFNTWQERGAPGLLPWSDDVEHLENYPDSYAWACVVEFNRPPDVVPERGCAIFLHVSEGGTGGCVGLSREDLARVLGWLDPARHPCILITGTEQTGAKAAASAAAFAPVPLALIRSRKWPFWR